MFSYLFDSLSFTQNVRKKSKLIQSKTRYCTIFISSYIFDSLTLTHNLKIFFELIGSKMSWCILLESFQILCKISIFSIRWAWRTILKFFSSSSNLKYSFRFLERRLWKNSLFRLAEHKTMFSKTNKSKFSKIDSICFRFDSH